MEEKYIIPNLRNACRVLKVLARHEGSLTMSELADQLDIPRTTALRILRTFEVEGFVQRDQAQYRLGSGMIHVGLKALAGVNIRTIAVPVLKDLAEQTGETAHLAVLADDRSLILEVCDSPHPLHIASRPGSLAWLHASATGKVLMAHRLKGRIAEVFQDGPPPQLTPRTMTGVEEMEAEVERTLERGFGLDNEEYFEGARCLAAPVRNARQEVIAAVGITGATTRFTMDRLDEFAGYVKDAAQRISEQLGSAS